MVHLGRQDRSYGPVLPFLGSVVVIITVILALFTGMARLSR